MPLVSPARTFTSVADALNVATPDKLPEYLQQLAIGSCLRADCAQLYQQTPVANAYNLAAVLVIALPDDAKAASVIRATVRTGTTKGEYTSAAINATPQTTQIAVTPSGDLAVIAGDAPTGMDVVYQPLTGDVYQVTLPVATGIMTLPAAQTTAPSGVMILMEAEVLAGTTLGKKIILAPAADNSTLPATTKACLSADHTLVLFNNATDAVTSARVKFMVIPAIDVNTILEAAASF